MMESVGRSREKDDEFIAWIKTQPEWKCIITGMDPDDFAHLRSKGASGSDYWPIPLVRVEHSRSHQEVAWWYRDKVALAEWFYGLKELHSRYEHRLDASLAVGSLWFTGGGNHPFWLL